MMVAPLMPSSASALAKFGHAMAGVPVSIAWAPVKVSLKNRSAARPSPKQLCSPCPRPRQPLCMLATTLNGRAPLSLAASYYKCWR